MPKLELEKQTIPGLDPSVPHSYSHMVIDDDDVQLHFHDGTLIMYHGAQCCEAVTLTAKPDDDWANGWHHAHNQLALESIWSAEVESPGDSETRVTTLIEVMFNHGPTIQFVWIGTSNGYYGVSIDITWRPK
jgi:hypothetical protein